MDKRLPGNKSLLFKHEVLRSRLDIRDFFFENTNSEIYENIGQVLSYVRIQLQLLERNEKNEEASVAGSSGNLIAQVIRDLRIMSKNFYPDRDILQEEGLDEGLQLTAMILYEKTITITNIGIRKNLQPDFKIFVFRIVHELFIAIKAVGGELISLIISYLRQDVQFVITYFGQEVKLLQGPTLGGSNSNPTINERIELVDGKLEFSKKRAKKSQIKLVFPLNLKFYESNNKSCPGR